MDKVITIMGCDREPSYLSQTMKTIPPGFAVELFFQTRSSSDVDFPGKVVKTEKLYDDPVRNSQYNYAKALAGTTAGLIVEDDVKFSVRFEWYLNRIQEKLTEKKIERYAVALYSGVDWEYLYDIGRGKRTSVSVTGFGKANTQLKLPAPFFVQHPLVEYPLDIFWCTQGMLYDIQTAREFSAYLFQNIGGEPYDAALRTYIRTASSPVRLLAATYSIVQHLGVVTTGLGVYHTARNFLDEIGG